uniref:Uncharacterized protein n=1 Tax=Triticum urartu TaxID=4572 RepID=A0A8R7UPT4_TRIUA
MHNPFSPIKFNEQTQFSYEENNSFRTPSGCTRAVHCWEQFGAPFCKHMLKHCCWSFGTWPRVPTSSSLQKLIFFLSMRGWRRQGFAFPLLLELAMQQEAAGQVTLSVAPFEHG